MLEGVSLRLEVLLDGNVVRVEDMWEDADMVFRECTGAIVYLTGGTEADIGGIVREGTHTESENLAGTKGNRDTCLDESKVRRGVAVLECGE